MAVSEQDQIPNNVERHVLRDGDDLNASGISAGTIARGSDPSADGREIRP
jgi:hypothetical protein